MQAARNHDSMGLPELKPLGLGQSLLIFGVASVALGLGTRYTIPWLSRATGHETILFWFLVAGGGIFLPLLIVSYLFLRAEGLSLSREAWRTRLRFRPMCRADWAWGLGALAVIGVLSGGIMQALSLILGEVDHSPTFMTFKPLTPGRYWLLAVWLPYWTLNILGEEIFWRGVLLPRQEVAFGRWTWLVHGTLWGVFHIPFGWQLLVTLLPILYIQSCVVQRRQNSWVGVLIHAGLNGPSFLAIAFGWLG